MEENPKDLNRIANIGDVSRCWTIQDSQHLLTSPMVMEEKPKGPKQGSQHLLTSPMSDGGDGPKQDSQHL